jgi:hypothetical protein
VGFWDGVERADFFESLALNTVIIPQGTSDAVSDTVYQVLGTFVLPSCANRYQRPVATELETAHLGQGDGSLGFAVSVGIGGSSGFCPDGVDAVLLVPGATLACLSA